MKDDTIGRQAVIDAVESVDWYHQNENGEMVHGANPDEHQAWYKADEVYTAIKNVPKAEFVEKPIGYADCAGAMLKMWIDCVLTDGEYFSIMNKLNAHWGKL